MKRLLRKIISPFFQWWFKKYYSKPRIFEYQGIKTTIAPGVFPPNFTISTKLLLRYLENLNLEGKSLLELGCGSGIIALYSAKKGAKVTATDINEMALKQLKDSTKENNLNLNIIKSDLFYGIPEINFNYIIINPPYYPKNPENIAEQAWYCGENFEYFNNLFGQIPSYLSSQTMAIMILSEDCDIKRIKNIAKQNLLELNLLLKSSIQFETNYLFQINNM